MKSKVFVALVIGIIIGGLGGFWFCRSTVSQIAPSSTDAGVYTCSMHPQIRVTKPGNCPICQMPLVPVESIGQAGESAPVLSLSKQALAMAGIETSLVVRMPMTYDLRVVGKVQYNETGLATVTARVDGYIERLFVNVTGVQIKAGDRLAEVYSPQLLVAQQELLVALKEGQTAIAQDAMLKLRNLGLTQQQVSDLIAKGKVEGRVTILSPISGTVIEKATLENNRFSAGDILYRIANLETVWVYLDVYEYDLPWIRYGQAVELVTEAYPGRVIKGILTFIDPVLDERTRTVKVRVHVDNADRVLRPGMYVRGTIKARLGPDGRAGQTGLEGRFTCRMHPQIVADAPGVCPECGMGLEQIPPASGLEQDQELGLLAVPIGAVLDSGTRTIVYVERSPGIFESRQVVLGPRSGEFYPVLSGLEEGQRVVTRGGFLIDSQFQITGHSSLYYPGGTQVAGQQIQEDSAMGQEHPSVHNH